MTMSFDMIANVYSNKIKILYPYEYFKGENSYNNILSNISIEDYRSSLTEDELTLEDEVDEFNRSKSKKKCKELTIEYIENDVRILEHCFNLFVKLNINTYKLHPLHYISLPGYCFDCFLKLKKVELDTIKDEQMLKDFITAIRASICDVMGNRKMI